MFTLCELTVVQPIYSGHDQRTMKDTIIHLGFLPLFFRAFAVRAFAASFNAFVCWSSYLR